MAYDQGHKYKLGVALSGGGARGLAHAGALKAIEEAGLRPDIIAGVSAGSIVAVMYSAGISPDRILELFSNGRFSDFAEFSIGKGGLLKMDRFIRVIAKSLGAYKRLEDLPIPTFIGTTDFDHGVAVEFHEGDISPIIKASCSIPVVFPPVSIGGTAYVDGGVLRNLPAWTIRDKCERLIGINVSPLGRVKTDPSIFEIAMRSYSLLAKANQKQDMDVCDLVVQTRELTHRKVFDLKEINKVFTSGYVNMRKTLRDAGWWKTDSI